MRQVTQESRSKRGTSHRREGPNEAAPVVGITSLEFQNESVQDFRTTGMRYCVHSLDYHEATLHQHLLA